MSRPPAGALLPAGRQELRLALRSDRAPVQPVVTRSLPGAVAAGPGPGCGRATFAGLSDQPLRSGAGDYLRALPTPLANRTVLQVDQTALAHPAVLRTFGKRDSLPDLGRHLQLSSRGPGPKGTAD